MTTTSAEIPQPRSAPEAAPSAPSGDAASSKNNEAESSLRASIPTYAQDKTRIQEGLQSADPSVKSAAQRELGWHHSKIALGGGEKNFDDFTPAQKELLSRGASEGRVDSMIRTGLEGNMIAPKDVPKILSNTQHPDFGGDPLTLENFAKANKELLSNPEFVGALNPDQAKDLQSFEAAQKAQQEALVKNTESIRSTLSEIDPSGGSTYLSGETAKMRPSDEQIQSMAQALGSETLSSDQIKTLDEHPELLRKLAGTEIAGGQLTINKAGKLEARVPEIKDGNIDAAIDALKGMSEDMKAHIPAGSVAGKHEYGEYRISADKAGFEKTYDGNLLNTDLASGNPKAFDAIGDPGAKKLATPDSIRDGWSKLYTTDRSKAFGLMDEGGYFSRDQMMDFRDKNNEHFILNDGCFIDKDGARKTVTDDQRDIASALPPDKLKKYITTLEGASSSIPQTQKPAEVAKVADSTQSQSVSEKPITSTTTPTIDSNTKGDEKQKGSAISYYKPEHVIPGIKEIISAKDPENGFTCLDIQGYRMPDEMKDKHKNLKYTSGVYMNGHEIRLTANTAHNPAEDASYSGITVKVGDQGKILSIDTVGGKNGTKGNLFPTAAEVIAYLRDLGIDLDAASLESAEKIIDTKPSNS